MKVRGLRIGNYISGIYINGDCSEYDSYEENEELCEVVGIDSVGFSEYNIWVAGLEKSGIENYDSFEPIPLTEQWLIDFGFVKDKNGNYWIDLHTHYLEITPSNGHWHPTYVQVPEMSHEDEQRVSTNRIEFVHELQNLFFAITGKELEVKTEINKYY